MRRITLQGNANILLQVCPELGRGAAAPTTGGATIELDALVFVLGRAVNVGSDAMDLPFRLWQPAGERLRVILGCLLEAQKLPREGR